MPFPCHAVPLRVKMCLSQLIYVVRPRLIHICHAAPVPCSDHAVLLKATTQHGRRQRPVSYLPALGFFRLPRGVPRRLISEAYQSSSQRSVPTTVKIGSSTLQKILCVFYITKEMQSIQHSLYLSALVLCMFYCTR